MFSIHISGRLWLDYLRYCDGLKVQATLPRKSKKSVQFFYDNPEKNLFFKIFNPCIPNPKAHHKPELNLILNLFSNPVVTPFEFYCLETIDWWTSNQVSVVMSVISIIYPDMGFDFPHIHFNFQH